MRKIAIIPARGGSKRILKKNIRLFIDKPIIYYSITAALNSSLFDEVIVSTDDVEIKEIALQYGAEVPFLRSDENSGDYATTADVLLEVLNEYSKQNTLVDFICCIYPTAPFVTPLKIKQAYNLLIEGNYDSVFPVEKYSYPIQRALKMDDGKISMIQTENMQKRSQDLMPAYHDCGQFYWLRQSSFIEQKKIFMENSGAIEYSANEVQDIDNEMDWKIAEIKYQLLKS